MPVIPALWEAETGQEFKTSPGNLAKPHLNKKCKKSAGHDGGICSFSYLEAEAKDPPGLGRPRLQ